MHILLAGPTGQIGSALLAQLLAAGHQVTAATRKVPSHTACQYKHVTWIHYEKLFEDKFLPHSPIDWVISCVASRTGAPLDAKKVDFGLNIELLTFAQKHKLKGFMLLSAICVQKPKLAFQGEKLKFEKCLREADLPFVIVRPTAFFQSLSTQVRRCYDGKVFYLFGNGHLTACKPISPSDLSAFMIGCLNDQTRHYQIHNIGGPGPAITPRDQVKLLESILQRPIKTRSISPKIFDVLRWFLWPFCAVSSRASTAHEYLRIAKYYATESMLVWDSHTNTYNADLTAETGQDTLDAHYRELIAGFETERNA